MNLSSHEKEALQHIHGSLIAKLFGQPKELSLFGRLDIIESELDEKKKINHGLSPGQG